MDVCVVLRTGGLSMLRLWVVYCGGRLGLELNVSFSLRPSFLSAIDLNLAFRPVHLVFLQLSMMLKLWHHDVCALFRHSSIYPILSVKCYLCAQIPDRTVGRGASGHRRSCRHKKTTTTRDLRCRPTEGQPPLGLW